MAYFQLNLSGTIISFLCILPLVSEGFCLGTHQLSHRLQARQAILRPDALRNFEVREPAVVPTSKPCSIILLEHTFSSSYRHPENVSYSPPLNCGPAGSWASVIFNLTVTSIGTQYDRLGRLYLNDIEVWRTSTAEPMKRGVIWTVTRDMTKYMPLLAQSTGTLSLDIGNIVNASLNLDGNFEATLSADFYPPTPQFPAGQTADQIVKLGHGTGNSMSSSVVFPKNLATAFVEIFASGSAQEEFWYTNIPDEYGQKVDPNGTSFSRKGPFREVQLWIDKRLAGVAYPFPVIYTGGILLSWWRPIAAIGAYDAPSYFIDITPFIPYLSDGSPHKFTLLVEGQGEKKSINPEWFFSCSAFVTLDPSHQQTTGKIVEHITDSNTFVKNNTSPNAKNQPKSADAGFTVTSYRKLKISSTIVTGTGGKKNVTFEQDLHYTNEQSVKIGGASQTVRQTSSGTSSSTHGNEKILLDSFSFPLTLTTDFITQPKNQGATLQGDLAHGYNRFLAFPLHQSLVHTEINTTQHSNGKLEFNATGTVMSGVARTSQKFDYQDSRGNTFGRDVEIFNNTNIIRDVRSGTLSKLVPQEVVKPSHTVVYTMEDNLKDYKDQDIGRNSHLFDIKRLGVGN